MGHLSALWSSIIIIILSVSSPETKISNFAFHYVIGTETDSDLILFCPFFSLLLLLLHIYF